MALLVKAFEESWSHPDHPDVLTEEFQRGVPYGCDGYLHFERGSDDAIQSMTLADLNVTNGTNFG